MPWQLQDKGDGWATRRVPSTGSMNYRSGWGYSRSPRMPGHYTIYKDGEPVDTAMNATSANRRIKKYKSGELPMPKGVA